MEQFDEPENLKEAQAWNTNVIKENRDNWNLAADIGLLQYLEKFGNRLLNETETTLKLLDSFESDLNTSCVHISNITNKFLSLADLQFVENRVYDDEETPSVETDMNAPVRSKQEEDMQVFDRLKESVNNGIAVLNTKFEAVQVEDSDDDDDDDNSSRGVVYKPINRFNNRPLPHLIGSLDFIKDPTLGLEELVSDEDESNDEDDEDESSSGESKDVAEENEDSEPESDRPVAIPEAEPRDILFKPTSTSFADHLAKRLQHMENESQIQPANQKQHTRNLFSTTPPPLDDSCDEDISSNDDLIFGHHSNQSEYDNTDLFIPQSESKLWDGEDKINENDKGTKDNRKKLKEDIERALSQNFKFNNNNNVCQSPPSPPLMNEDEYGTDHDKNIKNSKSLLFNNNENDDDDEGDDLFKPPAKSVGDNKNKIFPGSINVFGQNTKLFTDSTSKQDFQVNNNNINRESNISKNNKSLGAESDAKIESSKTKTNTSTRFCDSDSEEKYWEGDGDENNEANDLFKSMLLSNQQGKSSSQSSSIKLSESLQDDNLSIKSNRSAGLFDDILSNTKKSSIRKTMDDLFSDLDNHGATDNVDDLFCSNINSKNNINDFGKPNKILPKSKSNKPSIIDDLFSAEDDNSDDLFGNLNIGHKNKEIEQGKTISNPDLNERIDKNKKLSKPLSIFDDEDEVDIFGSDLLGASSLMVSKKPVCDENSQKGVATQENTKEKLKNSPSLLPAEANVKGPCKLFEDTDDDLFGVAKTSTSRDHFKSTLLSETESKSGSVSYNISDALVEQSKVIENRKHSEVASRSDIRVANVKSISLFSDDDGDDLFSNTNNNNCDNMKKPKEERSVKTADVTNDQLRASSSLPPLLSNCKNGFTKSVSNDRNNSQAQVVLDSVDSNNIDDSPLFGNNPRRNDHNTYHITHGSKDSLFERSCNTETDVHIIETESNNHFTKSVVKDDSLTTKTVDVSAHPASDHLFSDSGNDASIDSSLAPLPEIKSDDCTKRKDEISHIDNSSSADPNLFDSNNSLPSIPSNDGNKKPQVLVKPSKRDPPKSLNISPYQLNNDSKKYDNGDKLTQETIDGSVVSSEHVFSKITPGRLNLDKSFIINPKALLPGAKPTSFKKSSAKENSLTESPEELVSDECGHEIIEKSRETIGGNPTTLSSSLLQTQSEPVLHSIAKDRAKIQVKRRPQTRKARKEALLQSALENNDFVSEGVKNTSIEPCLNKVNSTSSLACDQHSNILSPSTDEEDLFGVPPLDLPADYNKVSTSPANDIFGYAPSVILSPDLNNKNNSENTTLINCKITHKDDNVSEPVINDINSVNEILKQSLKKSNKSAVDSLETITSNATDLHLGDHSSAMNVSPQSLIIKHHTNNNKNFDESDLFHSADDDSDLFFSKSEFLNEDKNDDDVNNHKKLADAPPNRDSIIATPYSTLQNDKKDNTILSVPKNINADTLFGDDLSDKDDDLFSISSSSSEPVIKREDNKKPTLQTKKTSDIKNKTKSAFDSIFSSDNDDDDNLFCETKSLKKNYSKVSVEEKHKDILKNNEKKKLTSFSNTKSLFGDDEDENDDSIFPSSSLFGKKLSDNVSHPNNSGTNFTSSSSGLIKKSADAMSQQTKMKAASTKQSFKKDKDFIDPLAALSNE